MEKKRIQLQYQYTKIIQVLFNCTDEATTHEFIPLERIIKESLLFISAK